VRTKSGTCAPFSFGPSSSMKTSLAILRGVAARFPRRAYYAIALAGFLPSASLAQTSFTWQQIKDKFEAGNPTLKAARLNIDEARVAEITAYLRPNPDFTFSTDGTQIVPYGSPDAAGVTGVWRPFAGTQFLTAFTYLHERDHKRELRRDQAKQATAVAESTYADQERGLVFNL